MSIKRIQITFEDDSTGTVTNMFDENGDDTDIPWHATVVVGQYIDGPYAGKWFTHDVRGLEWFPYAS